MNENLTSNLRSMTKRSKRLLSATLFFSLFGLFIGMGIIYFRSLPDYREYKIGIDGNSVLIVRSSLDWKKEGEESRQFIPVLTTMNKKNNDLSKGFSLIRLRPEGVLAWMQNLFRGDKRALPFADQMLISCAQTPISDCLVPTQIRDREHSSMQKMADQYKGIGAFDTTLSKGQSISGTPWMATKDVVPKRFKSRRPNDSELRQVIYSVFARSLDGNRYLKIRINALYDSKHERVMDSDLRKIAESIRIAPANKFSSSSPEVKGSR